MTKYITKINTYQQYIKNNLKERNCPFSGGNSYKELFALNQEQFVKQNPTHNIEWFSKLNIPDDFEFPFYECSNCDFVFSGLKLNDHLHEEFYNIGILEEKSKAKIQTFSKRINKIKQWHNLAALWKQDFNDVKVLDFGGGWGDFLSIADMYGTEVYGLEYDQRKINYASEHGIAMGDMDFIKENAPYHIFMCDQVLEHLDDPVNAVKTMYKLLHKDAIGYVGVPNFKYDKMRELAKKANDNQKMPKEVNPFGHLNYFTPDNFKKLFESNGFNVLDKSYFNVKKEKKSGLLSLLFKFKRTSFEKELSTSLYLSLK